MSAAGIAAILVITGAVAAGLALLIRRGFPGLARLDPGPWSSTLSYLATAYAVIIGFSIVFLFGEVSNARQTIGDEATSIGTAFDEIALFPDDAPEVRHALICYSRAVAEIEWPDLARGASAPEVDQAYLELVLALGGVSEPADETFQPAAATNTFVQVGNISTARETRLVAAGVTVHSLQWALLLGGGVLVVGLLFVVSSQAHPAAQATLVGLSAAFTAVMILIVFVLSTPFRDGVGRLTPRLIEETTTFMESEAPDAAARPCDVERAD